MKIIETDENIILNETLNNMKTYLTNKHIEYNVIFDKNNKTIKIKIMSELDTSKAVFKRIYNLLENLVDTKNLTKATLVINSKILKEFTFKSKV